MSPPGSLRPGAGVTLQPLRLPRAAQGGFEESSCSSREKDEGVTNLRPGNSKVTIFRKHN